MRAARRGHTLVEVLLFSAIGLVVLSAVWYVFATTMRRGAGADDRMQAVQAALVLSRHLEQDLAGLYEDPEHVITYHRRGDDYELEFFAFAPGAPGEEWSSLPLERVHYRLDGATGRVTRARGEDPGRALPGSFEQLGIRIDEAAPAASVPGEGPALPRAPSLTLAVTAIPHRALRVPRAERRPQDRTVVLITAAREVVSVPVAYPFWNRLPYGPGRPVQAP